MKYLSSKGFQDLDSLERLAIRNCKKLKSFPDDGLPPSLLQLVISDCPLLKERSKKDKGREWFKIAHIPKTSLWIRVLFRCKPKFQEVNSKVSLLQHNFFLHIDRRFIYHVVLPPLSIKLTHLIPKDTVDQNLIKKNLYMVSICYLQIVLIINLFQQKAMLTYQMFHIIDFFPIDLLSYIYIYIYFQILLVVQYSTSLAFSFPLSKVGTKKL